MAGALVRLEPVPQEPPPVPPPRPRRKCKHPHAARVEQLVSEHLAWSRQVARQALRILPASVDVDDVAGPAAAALLAAAESYRADHLEAPYLSPVTFRGYARPRVYFACLMSCRRRAYVEATMEPLKPLAELVPSGQDLEREASTNEARRLLLEARSAGGKTMPCVERSIIRLMYDQGLTVRDAAAEMRIGVRRAGELHQRALARLRGWFERRGVFGLEDVL